eukprot:Hpha_TRINITY_DN16676_c3_g2::TRINITY_DN16676_c3_g2_i1::g.182879::m.182879
MEGPPLNVVIPLGGVGSRFQKEGFLTRPKPFVRVQGKEMLLWVIDNMRLRHDDTLTLVFNPAWMSMNVFMQEIAASVSPQIRLVELPGPTRGAAETVLIGLQAQPPEVRRRPTLLADGDTFYDPTRADVVNLFRNQAARGNGAVFVFHDTNPKPIYSYCRVDSPQAMQIVEIREKVKISDYANSGVYCFPNGDQLAEQCAKLIAEKSTQLSQDGVGEFYTSGVIAAMIRDRVAPFRAIVLPTEGMHVVGTPVQCQDFARSHPPRSVRVCFTLERVLITPTGHPIERNVAHLRQLKKLGLHITVHTSRSDSQDVLRILREQKIPCDAVFLNRPEADVYVDANTADSLLGDIDKQLGFYPDSPADYSSAPMPTPLVVAPGNTSASRRMPLAAVIAALSSLFVLVLTGLATPSFMVGSVLGAGGTMMATTLLSK